VDEKMKDYQIEFVLNAMKEEKKGYRGLIPVTLKRLN
tara:strand:- start:954 stop:1064 length:111 start_codon:yes stop_codon:yes gene_type:complete